MVKFDWIWVPAIGKKGQRHRLWQMAAVGAQELVHLSSLVRKVLIGGIHGVDDQQDVGGVLAAGKAWNEVRWR